MRSVLSMKILGAFQLTQKRLGAEGVIRQRKVCDFTAVAASRPKTNKLRLMINDRE